MAEKMYLARVELDEKGRTTGNGTGSFKKGVFFGKVQKGIYLWEWYVNDNETGTLWAPNRARAKEILRKRYPNYWIGK